MFKALRTAPGHSKRTIILALIVTIIIQRLGEILKIPAIYEKHS